MHSHTVGRLKHRTSSCPFVSLCSEVVGTLKYSCILIFCTIRGVVGRKERGWCNVYDSEGLVPACTLVSTSIITPSCTCLCPCPYSHGPVLIYTFTQSHPLAILPLLTHLLPLIVAHASSHPYSCLVTLTHTLVHATIVVTPTYLYICNLPFYHLQFMKKNPSDFENSKTNMCFRTL